MRLPIGPPSWAWEYPTPRGWKLCSWAEATKALLRLAPHPPGGRPVAVKLIRRRDWPRIRRALELLEEQERRDAEEPRVHHLPGGVTVSVSSAGVDCAVRGVDDGASATLDELRHAKATVDAIIGELRDAGPDGVPTMTPRTYTLPRGISATLADGAVELRALDGVAVGRLATIEELLEALDEMSADGTALAEWLAEEIKSAKAAGQWDRHKALSEARDVLEGGEP